MAFLKRNESVRQEGQILLIVILTMIVALTVGLSIAARIVTELKISKQNEESQRAFQAAEAGIAQTLTKRSPINVENLDNNATVSTEYTINQGNTVVMNNGLEVDQVSGGDVWLSDYSQDPNLLYKNQMGNGNTLNITMYWGSSTQDNCFSGSGDRTAPAIEIVALKKIVGGSPQIIKSIYEATGCKATRIKEATEGQLTTSLNNTPNANGPTFRYRRTLSFGGASDFSSILIMKVIPIFNSTIVAFQSSSGVFPSQGAVVTSTGKSGDTVRKVTYYQSYPQIPIEIFPYSQLSQ